MYRRVCDKCKKDIQNEEYWEISRIHWGKRSSIDTNQLEWHLCEKCYEKVMKLVQIEDMDIRR